MFIGRFYLTNSLFCDNIRNKSKKDFFMNSRRMPFGEQSMNLELEGADSPKTTEATPSPETKSSEAFERVGILRQAETDLPLVKEYFEQGLSFEEYYRRCQQVDSTLPAYEEFLEKSKQDVEQADKVIEIQNKWSTEASKVLDTRFGVNNYRIVTMERGARAVRYHMSAMGKDVTPMWGNKDFFLPRGPENWAAVKKYMHNLDLSPEQILADDRQLVALDTGYEGTVIKGLQEFTALNVEGAEDNKQYADRIAAEATDANVVIVGREDYGLREELKNRGIAISEFTPGKYRIATLEDGKHVDKVIEVETQNFQNKETAEFFYGEGVTWTPPLDLLVEGKKLLFVTTEVNPENEDQKRLSEYLEQKGVGVDPRIQIIARTINDKQKALLQKMHGYMVESGSGALMEQLIKDNPELNRLASTFEDGPCFSESVSRASIQEDGTVAFKHFSKECQMEEMLFIDKIRERAKQA